MDAITANAIAIVIDDYLPDRNAEQARIRERLMGNPAFTPKHLTSAITLATGHALAGITDVAKAAKEELTVIGTKVQRFLFDMCNIEAAKPLDMLVDEFPVDLKCTVNKTWMIPRQSIGHWGLLVRIDLARLVFDVGILPFDSCYLTGSENQDKKTSVSAYGITNVDWLFNDLPFVQTWR